MVNDLAPELCRRKRTAWGAFKNIEGVAKKTKLRAYLFYIAVLLALTNAEESRVPSSAIERRSGIPSITPRNRRSDGPDTLCDIVMTVGPGRLLTGSLGTSKNSTTAERQRDG
uniref:Transposase n=1 Tax=Haemonchus contortus TaxID=6289 RepID=A0A7I5EDZ0_HAECO